MPVTEIAEIEEVDSWFVPVLDLREIGRKIANEEGLSRPLLTAVPHSDEWEDSSVWAEQSLSRESYEEWGIDA